MGNGLAFRLELEPMAQPIRVSVVEDDPVLRESLQQIVQHPPDLNEVGAWPNASSALQYLSNAKPDVIVLDINLSGENGIDWIPRFKEVCPLAQIMMLTVYEDTENIFRALAAGATGYLVKRTSAARLISAIIELHAGESPMSGHIARKLVESLGREPATPTTSLAYSRSQLTQREREVLGCLAEGCLYKEVAERLGMTIHTVRTHIRSIYEKLQVRSRTEAVMKFLGGR